MDLIKNPFTTFLFYSFIFASRCRFNFSHLYLLSLSRKDKVDAWDDNVRRDDRR